MIIYKVDGDLFLEVETNGAEILKNHLKLACNSLGYSLQFTKIAELKDPLRTPMIAALPGRFGPANIENVKSWEVAIIEDTSDNPDEDPLGFAIYEAEEYEVELKYSIGDEQGPIEILQDLNNLQRCDLTWLTSFSNHPKFETEKLLPAVPITVDFLRKGGQKQFLLFNPDGKSCFWDPVEPKIRWSFEDHGFEQMDVKGHSFIYPGIVGEAPSVERKTFGSGGNGAARSDGIDEVEYFWSGNVAIGLMIGLEIEQYIEIDKIDLAFGDLKKKGFCPTNVPYDEAFDTLWDVLMGLGESGENGPAILRGSEIIYLKRFKTKTEGVVRKNRPEVPRSPLLIIEATPTYDICKFGEKIVQEPAKILMRNSLRKAMGGSADECYIKTLGEEPRTNQEWCHLIGHGDGGDETQQNLVAGSKHCNTEQLAIELGLRCVRDAKETKKLVLNNVELNVLALLKTMDSPIAIQMTYTIIHENTIVFCHVYDAQGESFNYHEFLILQTTVERAISAAIGKLPLYQQRVARKLEIRGSDMNYKYDNVATKKVCEKIRLAREFWKLQAPTT